MLNKKKTKKIVIFSLLVVFLIIISLALFFTNPEELVDKIGTRNGYIILFLASLFGGLSSFGAVFFLTFLTTLLLGGLNPIYAGLIAGVGLAIGDMLMFHVGSRGRDLLSKQWDERINKVSNVIKKRFWLKKAIPYLAYIYLAFTPFPNDVLILFLAAIKFPAKKMYLIIILGDITYVLIVSMIIKNANTFF